MLREIIMKKITFLGDIMCEEPLLSASRRGKGHDFSPVFKDCRDFFAASDFVVGNLETVFAGKEAGYTDSLFSFNTPDSFARAMADSGVDLVTTATNHSLDRDKSGLLRTLNLLDWLGVDHIGAYRNKEERDRIYIRQFEGKKVSFLNYTYGTNLNESPFKLEEEEYYLLNLLMPQKKLPPKKLKGVKGFISRGIYRTVPLKRLLQIKKLIGREYANKYTDVLASDSLREEYLDRARKDVIRARKESDIVIVCLHIGGQFNEMPGEQVKYFTKLFADAGADYMINTHAHVVQPCERIGSTFVAHCLGNFSISPGSVYIPHELKPDYSIALHLCIEKDSVKLTFSVLRIVENKKHGIRVVPVHKLASELDDKGKADLLRDVAFIYRRFTGSSDQIEIQDEYDFDNIQVCRCNK